MTITDCVCVHISYVMTSTDYWEFLGECSVCSSERRISECHVLCLGGGGQGLPPILTYRNCWIRCFASQSRFFFHRSVFSLARARSLFLHLSSFSLSLFISLLSLSSSSSHLRLSFVSSLSLSLSHTISLSLPLSISPNLSPSPFSLSPLSLLSFLSLAHTHSSCVSSFWHTCCWAFFFLLREKFQRSHIGPPRPVTDTYVTWLCFVTTHDLFTCDTTHMW